MYIYFGFKQILGISKHSTANHNMSFNKEY